MQSISESSLAALLNSKTVYVVRPERSEAPERTQRQEPSDQVTRTPKGCCRGAQMFGHELRMRLELRFSSSFESKGRIAERSTPYREMTSPSGVAADVLQSARQIADSESGSRAATIAGLRESVREAGDAGLKAAESGEERSAVRDTADLVNRGLAQIEQQPATSRYDALDIYAKSKQRTSIRIRTQEGDVVRFDLKQVDRMSLSDVAETNENGSTRETELRVSSNSRLSLRVKGDLNEAEMEAIRSVFATAESLADEFFAGDMSAALEIAAGLEFDSEQLARVSMRFRSVEQVRAAQVSRVTTEAPPVEPVLDPVAAPEPGRIAIPALEPTDRPVFVSPAITGIARPTPEPAVTAPAVDAESTTQVEDGVAVASQPEVADAAPRSGFGSLLEYLGKLADFLEETTARFRSSMEFSVSDQQMRFEITESLQLEILRSVMITKAPEQAGDESDSAGELIRSLDVEVDDD